jgi:hypothetical protein
MDLPVPLPPLLPPPPAPEDSLVLSYAGRAVAILRPADLDELRQQARTIFGLQHEDGSEGEGGSSSTGTRNVIRFFYYTAPPAQTACGFSSYGQTYVKRRKLNNGAGKQREFDYEEEEGEDAAAEEGQSGNKRKQPADNAGPIRHKRELGETLLARLRDDFELFVEIVTIPIKKLGIRVSSRIGSRSKEVQDEVEDGAVAGASNAGRMPSGEALQLVISV